MPCHYGSIIVVVIIPPAAAIARARAERIAVSKVCWRFSGSGALNGVVVAGVRN
jgi:hypothetical protein